MRDPDPVPCTPAPRTRHSPTTIATPNRRILRWILDGRGGTTASQATRARRTDILREGRGRAASVIATRENTDPNRDLWWAHTGGGGGNFGVVTRYWFRDQRIGVKSGACIR